MPSSDDGSGDRSRPNKLPRDDDKTGHDDSSGNAKRARTNGTTNGVSSAMPTEAHPPVDESAPPPTFSKLDELSIKDVHDALKAQNAPSCLVDKYRGLLQGDDSVFVYEKLEPNTQNGDELIGRVVRAPFKPRGTKKEKMYLGLIIYCIFQDVYVVQYTDWSVELVTLDKNEKGITVLGPGAPKPIFDSVADSEEEPEEVEDEPEEEEKDDDTDSDYVPGDE